MGATPSLASRRVWLARLDYSLPHVRVPFLAARSNAGSRRLCLSVSFRWNRTDLALRLLIMGTRVINQMFHVEYMQIIYSHAYKPPP